MVLRPSMMSSSSTTRSSRVFTVTKSALGKESLALFEMGETFDLADVTLGLLELQGDLFTGLAGGSHVEHPPFDGCQASLGGSPAAGDLGPAEETFHEFGTAVDAGGDFIDANTIVVHVEHPSFDWAKVSGVGLAHVEQPNGSMELSRQTG